MASSTTLIASLLLFHVTEAQKWTSITGASSPLPQTIDCGGACEGRCKLSKRPNLRKRACGSCCAKCSCVPPGTAGNYEFCPCYFKLTTRHQILKCP